MPQKYEKKKKNAREGKKPPFSVRLGQFSIFFVFFPGNSYFFGDLKAQELVSHFYIFPRCQIAYLLYVLFLGGLFSFFFLFIYIFFFLSFEAATWRYGLFIFFLPTFCYLIFSIYILCRFLALFSFEVLVILIFLLFSYCLYFCTLFQVSQKAFCPMFIYFFFSCFIVTVKSIFTTRKKH